MNRICVCVVHSCLAISFNNKIICRYLCNIADPKSGYIPGAKSVPHPELLNKNTGLLKDIEVIKQSKVSP